MLIGDPEYYGRHFGFIADADRQLGIAGAVRAAAPAGADRRARSCPIAACSVRGARQRAPSSANGVADAGKRPSPVRACGPVAGRDRARRWPSGGCRRSSNGIPPHCGDSAMRIARDGTWYHEGAPIRRPAMVRLFASAAAARGGRAAMCWSRRSRSSTSRSRMRRSSRSRRRAKATGKERRIAFRLNTDEPVVAGPEHRLHLVEGRPYLTGARRAGGGGRAAGLLRAGRAGAGGRRRAAGPVVATASSFLWAAA